MTHIYTQYNYDTNTHKHTIQIWYRHRYKHTIQEQNITKMCRSRQSRAFETQLIQNVTHFCVLSTSAATWLVDNYVKTNLLYVVSTPLHHQGKVKKLLLLWSYPTIHQMFAWCRQKYFEESNLIGKIYILQNIMAAPLLQCPFVFLLFPAGHIYDQERCFLLTSTTSTTSKTSSTPGFATARMSPW